MEIVILIVILLLIGVLLSFFIIFRQQMKIRENTDLLERTDRELTDAVSKNIDLEQQLRKMEHDYKEQKNMTEEMVRIREQTRTLKHDMKNHILVILSYLDEHRITEAREYTGEFLDKLNFMYTYVTVGNSLLNYILNRKMSEARREGVDCKAEIENLSFSYMDSLDLSSLLNNILDNAIEAAANSENRRMTIAIDTQKGFDRICIKNSIDESVLEQNKDLHTTKSESGHGLGIRQIKGIVAKYQGILDIDEEDLMFSVMVLLPQKE